MFGVTYAVHTREASVMGTNRALGLLCTFVRNGIDLPRPPVKRRGLDLETGQGRTGQGRAKMGWDEMVPLWLWGLIDCGSNLGQQPINQHLSATTTTVTITNHRHWQSSRAWSRRAWMQPLKVSANQRRRGPAHPSSPYAYCILVRPSGLR
ncbi:uncharacterized protein BDCG_08100 [Blastomyces dermatitidis ER-3]|uniref:Uncharacterized protein n=1 Tax=Ajellomyces dermatitidis (strain ER-3 / ATCC MYA-2586) TaxID=559297 RepID=A0ABP2EN51_AJEDR|nr:uncharacterized protein BDCG_08100 [Blastomyces dermatitidis ER-3]EEQ84831.1 hypothetical protein BDCG_08100 [Blastomyces dermatitidis ER-3]